MFKLSQIMKVRYFGFFTIFCLAIGFLAVPFSEATNIACEDTDAVTVESNFDLGPDGWRALDFFPGGPYEVPIPYYAPFVVIWDEDEGEKFIEMYDPSPFTFFFDAPEKFLGNKEEFIGGSISFSLTSTGGEQSWSEDNYLVLVGNGMVIVSSITPLPVLEPEWSAYSIDLIPENFLYDTSQGNVVSEDDFRNILSNLSALRISGEYYYTSPMQTTGLDSVRMIPAEGAPPCEEPVVRYFECPQYFEIAVDENECEWSVDSEDLQSIAQLVPGQNVECSMDRPTALGLGVVERHIECVDQEVSDTIWKCSTMVAPRDRSPAILTAENPTATYATSGSGQSVYWTNITDIFGISMSDNCTPSNAILYGIMDIQSTDSAETISGAPGAFKLDGLWANWHQVAFTLLNARDYTLIVKTLDAYGNFSSEQEFTLRIE